MANDSGFAGNPTNGEDAGSGDGGSGYFGDGGVDAGFDGGGGQRLPSALFVNASTSETNLGPVRLCWSTPQGGVIPANKAFPQQIMPASNFPGLPLGGAVLLGNASALTGGPLTLYAIRARQLEKYQQADVTCDKLICSGSSCLSLGTDYFALANVTLFDGVTNVVAIEGCLPSALDSNANAARCGATWTGASGNLHAEVLSLTDAPAAKGTLYVQAAQLSPGLATLLGNGGSATVSLGTANAAATTIANLGAEGQVLPSPPTGLPVFGLALADYGTYGIRIDVSGVDAGAGNLFMSFAQAGQLVDPGVDPVGFYNGGGTYLVAVLGDPNAPHAFSTGTSGAYDGTGLHVLVVRAEQGP
jgi:hypothetical protein